MRARSHAKRNLPISAASPEGSALALQGRNAAKTGRPDNRGVVLCAPDTREGADGSGRCGYLAGTARLKLVRRMNDG